MRKNSKNFWDEEKIEEKILYMVEKTKQITFPTHTEINDFFGDYKLSNAIRRHGGTKYWADKLGMQCKECESEFGYNFEELCKIDIMENCGLESQLCQIRYPYDILVERCAKIDVKAAKLFSNYGKSEYYSFNLEKKEQTCDFYVFYCLDKNQIKKIYIVPSIVMSGKKQFAIGKKISTYDKYLYKWNLINNFVDFIKESIK